MKFFSSVKSYSIKFALIVILFKINAGFSQNSCLVAQYNFSGNANDSKGSNHGTVYNATLTSDRFGNANSAYLFSSSSSSYIQIPYTNFFNPNYSFSLWVKPTILPSYGNSSILVSVGGNGGDQNMQLENNKNYGGSMGVITGYSLTAYQKSGSTVSVGGTCIGTMPNTNQWYHLVVTRDSNYYKIYVNGCLKVTSASTSGALPFYGNSNFDARIGCRERGSLYFDGVIDDVGIYSCALSPAEITKLYNNYKKLAITKDTTICKDNFQQFKLKAPNTYCTYRWVDMSSPSTVLSTDSQLLINITSTATFRCITNSKDTAFVKVRIIPRPKLNLGNDTFYCGKIFDTLDAGPRALKYSWDDNRTSRYRVVKDSGYYSVLYTDSFGCKARDTILLRIRPLPRFSLGPDTHYCNNFSRVLNTTSNAVKYIWNTSDTTQSITVKQKGKYWAEAKNAYNCYYRDSIEIMNPLLSSGFKMTNEDSCANTNHILFVDTSRLTDNSKVSSTFYFGDLSSALSDSIRKHYANSGTYMVKQIVKTNMNCIDSSVMTIKIWPNSKADFTIDDSTQCFNQNTFNYSNATSITNGSFNNYWTLGDGSNSANVDVSNKKYSNDTTYKVTLVTTSDKFCKDTVSKWVEVYTNSKLGFTIDRPAQCFDWQDMNITNASRIRKGLIATNIWHFTDNTTDTVKHIYHKKFSKPDSLEVELETITDKGCRDTLKKPFVIFPISEPDFNINIDTQCFKWHSFNYTNTTLLSQGTFNSKWNMGDTGISNNRDVVGKRYAIHGDYLVRLITTTDNLCADTVYKGVLIHASPVDTFSISNDRQCFRGNSFDFINLSGIANGGIVSQNWEMDDGSSFTSKNVLNHTYSSEDSFMVSLSSVSDKGCKDTMTRLAVTFAQPVAQYVIPNDSQCWQKNYFNIINSTKLKYGTLHSDWDFGDNTSDTDYSPKTKKYANKSASYTVRYKVMTEHNCKDSLNHKIHLFERPIADFDINDSIQCYRGHLFSFINKTAFSAMNTVSYFWDYGNGDSSIGMSPKTSVYSTPVYHNVQLIAYSYLTNCYDTTVKRVLPAPHSMPDFSVNKDSQCLKINKFIFTNKTSITLGSTIYNWDFGDSGRDTVTNPVKSYSQGFQRTVKLVATSNFGCKDSISKPLILIPHPKSGFTINDSSQCLNKHSLDFNNNSTVSYGPATYKWLFDDSQTSNLKDYLAKTFNTPDLHKIRLVTYTYQGCTDTMVRYIYLEKSHNTLISQTKPDSQCLKGNDFDFSASSSNSKVNFSIYNWSFGDGNLANGLAVSHSYVTYGIKSIMLETVSLNGCLDTNYYGIQVYPQSQIDFDAISPCFPDPVVFMDKSTLNSGRIVNYNWTFGDGNGSNLVNPSHFYSNTGKYDVRLNTNTDKGCKDTLLKIGFALVRTKPVAGFTQERLPDKQFDVATVKFYNQSSTDVNKYDWNFGNGNTSSDENPEADFNDTARKIVTLIVTNAEGCTDTFSAKTGSLVSDFMFYMPDAFTPGSNGINDVLKPVMTPYVRKYVMEVFNRWGERVFYSDDLTKGWDGTYKGQECEQGVYLCRVYLVPMRGAIRSVEISITLLR